MLLKWGGGDVVVPKLQTANTRARLAAIALGEAHGLARDTLGVVYTWGRSKEGQSGVRQDLCELSVFEPLLHECASFGHYLFAVRTSTVPEGRLG
eukprot:4125368-Pleurochrysis_carterae.AAC.2